MIFFNEENPKCTKFSFLFHCASYEIKSNFLPFINTLKFYTHSSGRGQICLLSLSQLFKSKSRNLYNLYFVCFRAWMLWERSSPQRPTPATNRNRTSSSPTPASRRTSTPSRWPKMTPNRSLKRLVTFSCVITFQHHFYLTSLLHFWF